MYVPSSQGVHCRSAVVLPAVLTKVPASQERHLAQRGAFELVLNVPLVQDAHVLSVVTLPSAATDWPAMHAVLAMHAVVGDPS